MLKTLIAGFAALGLITAAAPQKAHAGGDDILRGIVAGAIIIGTIAALDDAYDNRRYGDSHRHSHGHSHGHRHGQGQLSALERYGLLLSISPIGVWSYAV